ncbi:MAG: VWA domain-containing protein [Planctomycetota bacterium]
MSELMSLFEWSSEDRFAEPRWLLAGLAVAAVLMVRRVMVRRPAAVYSSLLDLAGAGRGLRAAMRWLPGVMLWMGAALLVVALARPQSGRGEESTTTEGVAIVMTVDRSNSMSQQMRFDGRMARRIDVVKQVLAEFVLGNDEGLEGRPNDLIGLVSFTAYADTVAPLSSQHDTLVQLAYQIPLDAGDRLSGTAGTAIGDGLALAAARLVEGEKSLAAARDDEFELTSKVIVLLTDGQENMGEIAAAAAAEIARELEIKIYPIAIGSDPVDLAVLRTIAERTGGEFALARDGEELREIYERIDELERSTVESVTYTSYTERFMPIAVLALVLIACATLLDATLLRRLP